MYTNKEFNSKGERINSRDNNGYTCIVDNNRGTCTKNRTGESVNIARGNDGKWGFDTNNVGPKNILGNSSSNNNKDWESFLGNTRNPFINWDLSEKFGNSTNIGNISTFNIPNLNIPNNIPLSNQDISDIKQIGDLSSKAHNLSEFIKQYENEPWEKVVKKERIFGIKAFTNKTTSHVKPHAGQVEQAKIELKEIEAKISNLSIGISNPQKTNNGNIIDYSNSSFNLENIKNLPIKEGCYELVNFKNTPLDDLDNGYIDQLLYGKSHKQLDPTKDIYQGHLTKKGVTIVKLDMSNCNIDGDKYSLGGYPIGLAIFEGSSNLRFLQHLNLSNNKIKDHSLYSFGNHESCKISPSLRSLDLSNNLITDNGVQSLSWSFKKNNLYYLNYLNISGNSEITEAGRENLVTAAKESLNQNLVIILDKQSSFDGVKSFMKKAFSYYRGEIKKFLDERQKTSEEVSKAALKVYGNDDWAHCKKFVAEGGFSIGLGVAAKVSNPITQNVLKVPNPYVKAGVVGVIVIDASIEAMGSVDWKDAGYCIATINKKVSNYILPEENVGFIGENGIVDESF